MLPFSPKKFFPFLIILSLLNHRVEVGGLFLLVSRPRTAKIF
jgi:hypothetical protein